MPTNQKPPSETQDAEGRRDQCLVREMTNYKTSRDYSLLWRIAGDQSIICICDCEDCRDVAHTICSEWSTDISARGTCYVSGKNEKRFIEGCEAMNVEFLIPNV